MACILKKYEVTVQGYGAGQFYAKNKNQARVRAFRSLQNVNDRITFKSFLKIVGNIALQEAPDGFGAPILVNGKPAHFLEHAGGNSIRFCYPDSDTMLIVHELDVSEAETIQ
ncbi:hypothetical protein K3725_09685 [Leisingera sp. S132]|uniref:hypothetical protein n=1 Tax=Leisingera sp. S132 TaxID=2867016 RepID=UPI0021A3C1EA|nr:hypothetical protein [Leisingera sp. S132]UWQ77594.1 hypothetical protein K3725_09685 [Leisingera sp. S132]